MSTDYRFSGRVGRREGGLRENDKKFLLQVLAVMSTEEYIEVSEVIQKAGVSESTAKGIFMRFPHLFEWKLRTIAYKSNTKYNRERSVNVYRLKPGSIERVRKNG